MNTQPRAFIFLAEGFEITEAMAPADILIRGGIELNIISIGSSHAVEDIMIFPGGMPGTSNLAECAPLMNRMQRHFAEGGTVAAICAAPGLVLSMLPLEKVVEARGSLRMTCYEGFEPALTAKGVTVIDQRQGVVEDGNIITASGPGHAIAFGLKILERISGAEAASTIAKALML